MSIRLMSLVWENGPMKQTERFVLLALADYANGNGECYPSIAGICRKTAMSERGVQAILRRLEADGWVTISTGNGRKNCNQYVFSDKINPAGDAPLEEETPQMDARNPADGCINPAGDAPEPSLTIIEPREPLCISPRAKPRKPETDLPEGWVPSDANVNHAQDKGLSMQEINDAADSFRNYHHSKQSRFRDWDAAWRTWISNAIKFGRSGGMAGKAAPGGYGQGSSIASIAARRRATGQV